MNEDLIWHNDGSPSACPVLPAADCPSLDEALTVEAWVRVDAPLREGLQPLVSRWRPRGDLDAFSAYDAGTTGGMVTKGFYGAVFDGRYLYYCPTRSREDRTSAHGRVLRYDSHRPFAEPASYAAYDASWTDGLHTAGFYGAVFDGRFVYFLPRDDGVVHHSRFLRYDTAGAFGDPGSWAVHDAGHAHSFQGAAFDGRYIYCCPGHHNPDGGAFADAAESSVVMRVDTQGGFTDPTSYRTFDARAVDAGAACFDGAAFDGRFVYFVPLTRGVVLRFDTRGSFDDAESWRTFDAAAAIGLGGCVGAVYDGRHLYFVPFQSGRVVRFDTTDAFDDAAAWTAIDAAAALGLAAAGCKGGFFDGRFVYFVPFRGDVPPGSRRSPFHGIYLRYDTAGAFDDPDRWAAHDAGDTDGLATTAYTAGASDGRYLYAAPWRGDLDGGDMHGRILRYDTVGSDGAFSLRACDYGHNGGLGGALPGARFLVNTDAGPFSVHAGRTPGRGRHHLAGVYDGRSVRLYIDGECAAAGPARGRLLGRGVAIDVGHVSGGAARFAGHIEEIRIRAASRAGRWVRGR